MMRSCGICFQARNLSGDRSRPEWEYIAPELLPEWSGVQDQLFGRLQEAAPAAGANVHYPFLHEGILRTFLSRIGNKAGDSAVYWKYGCWFGEEETRSTMLIQTSRGESVERPGAGEVTLSAWGSGAGELVEHVLKTLLDIPAGQAPEVKRTTARQERAIPGAEHSPGVEGLVISARGPSARKRDEGVHLLRLGRQQPPGQRAPAGRRTPLRAVAQLGLSGHPRQGRRCTMAT